MLLRFDGVLDELTYDGKRDDSDTAPEYRE